MPQENRVSFVLQPAYLKRAPDSLVIINSAQALYDGYTTAERQEL